MGSMPQQWLWINVFSMLGFGIFLCIIFGLLFSLVVVPIGLGVHIFLHKAFAKDEYFFKVYYRYLLRKNYMPASSRVHYTQSKFKGY